MRLRVTQAILLSLDILLSGAILAAPSNPAAASSALQTGSCPASLTLSAVAGPVPGAPEKRGPPAADMPPGATVVHLPLYPGATPSMATVRPLIGPVMPAAYRKVASATFALPAPYFKVSQWYRRALGSCGLPVNGSGPVQHGTAALLAGDFGQLRWLALSFRLISSRLTEVRYVVQVLSLPPRPPSSYVHGPFVSAAVLYRVHLPISGAIREYRFTITWPATLARLVTTINRPTRVFVPGIGAGGTITCVESAVISFRRVNGGGRRFGRAEFSSG